MRAAVLRRAAEAMIAAANSGTPASPEAA